MFQPRIGSNYSIAAIIFAEFARVFSFQMLPWGLSFFILDLDNFKKYNDTFGHIAGDEVLEKAGEILHRSLRKTDSAYRYGGEEFAIILPETLDRKAVHFAERLRVAFENQVFAIRQEENLSVTISIGVAQYTAKEEIATFIKQADDHMYTAKKKGKNRIYFL